MEKKTSKVRFVIAGSGWRSLYYVRIAKAFPEYFELCAMYCRTQEKADRMARENGIHTTTSIEECMSYNPDFIVVAVNKASLAEVTLEWCSRGVTVLCETPAALEIDKLNALWECYRNGGKIVIAEQYTHYPVFSSMIKVLESGIIGRTDCINISLAHDYHGASLMRHMLGINADTQFSVSSKVYEFETVETMSRYEKFEDGRTENKKRTTAVFEFEGGKSAFYDFDSEQYRSPIRKNTVKIQGVKGEIIDDTLYYLDDNYVPQTEKIEVYTALKAREYDNPNLRVIEEVEGIYLGVKRIYEPPFGSCGLNEDETAIALMMYQTGAYSRGEDTSPYPLKEALQDAYISILMAQSQAEGRTVYSKLQNWNHLDEQ